jgi:hypothetical protein
MSDPSLARRDFLTLAGLGSVVLASNLPGRAFAAVGARAAAAIDFSFVQLSDTHWGFSGPPNPEAANTLRQAVAAVNALSRHPDFVVFTGDLTHTTDDEVERRRRMAEFKGIVAGLRVKTRYFMPGEHDAALDGGKAYREAFGHSRYSFEHQGVHFAAIDNVSDPEGKLGDAQIDWLHTDLQHLAADAPIVVFTHRPLFDLAPQWDWATRDGAKAIDLLQHWHHVTVFYGHIHQEHHFETAGVAHHAARSLMFPLPPPMSQPKKAPVPWDPAHPRRGLGFREVEAASPTDELALRERSLEGAAPAAGATGAAP